MKAETRSVTVKRYGERIEITVKERNHLGSNTVSLTLGEMKRIWNSHPKNRVVK